MASTPTATLSSIDGYRALKSELTDVIKKEGSSFFMKRGPATGLLNQGATCYLNSAIQALFNTREFRQKMYQVSIVRGGIV